MDITEMGALPDIEWDRRRAKVEQIWGAFTSDEAAVAEWSATDQARVVREQEAMGFLDALGASLDLAAFAKALEPWSRLPGHNWFSGMTMMFVNQLANMAADDPRPIARLIHHSLSMPSDEADGRARMQALIDHVLSIQVQGQPAAGRVSTLCSFFWSMRDHEAWPVFWPSAADGLGWLGWLPREGNVDTLVDRYFQFRQVVVRCGRPPKEVEKAFSYLKDHPFVGLDPSLPSRLEEATELRATWNKKNGEYEDAGSALLAELQGRSVNGEILLLTQGLQLPLADALGFPLKVSKPYPKTSWGAAAPFKTEGLVTLLTEEGGRGPAIRVEATDKGLAIGMTPGRPPKEATPKDFTKQIAQELQAALPEGLQFLKVGDATEEASRLEPKGGYAPAGQPFIGRWFEWPEALQLDTALVDEAAAIGHQIKSLFAASVAIAKDEAADEAEPVVEGAEPAGEAVDHLQSAADDLRFDREVIQTWKDLLDDKRQLIFYGPPGTGKTFVARRLAQALVDEDHDRYELTQLHPSSSYEDFFEGYRPQTVGDQLVYQLKPGPLARIAEIAGTTNGPVVLVVDEINRANIPRVFGELLFLLEYRDEPIPTLYRESFLLPENLRIIGTMNTADRSIALVDAALRRRFHFVPLFPDQEPIAELLSRFLADTQPAMAWVAELLAWLNEELVGHLGHRDFQVGPSHFMGPALDELKVKRIWEHSVFPLIEEQFYNDQERVKSYRYEKAKQRWLAETGTPKDPVTPDAADESSAVPTPDA